MSRVGTDGGSVLSAGSQALGDAVTFNVAVPDDALEEMRNAIAQMGGGTHRLSSAETPGLGGGGTKAGAADHALDMQSILEEDDPIDQAKPPSRMSRVEDTAARRLQEQEMDAIYGEPSVTRSSKVRKDDLEDDMLEASADTREAREAKTRQRGRLMEQEPSLDRDQLTEARLKQSKIALLLDLQTRGAKLSFQPSMQNTLSELNFELVVQNGIVDCNEKVAFWKFCIGGAMFGIEWANGKWVSKIADIPLAGWAKFFDEKVSPVLDSTLRRCYHMYYKKSASSPLFDLLKIILVSMAFYIGIGLVSRGQLPAGSFSANSASSPPTGLTSLIMPLMSMFTRASSSAPAAAAPAAAAPATPAPFTPARPQATGFVVPTR